VLFSPRYWEFRANRYLIVALCMRCLEADLDCATLERLVCHRYVKNLCLAPDFTLIISLKHNVPLSNLGFYTNPRPSPEPWYVSLFPLDQELFMDFLSVHVLSAPKSEGKMFGWDHIEGFFYTILIESCFCRML
jgi:hypothetical protein